MSISGSTRTRRGGAVVVALVSVVLIGFAGCSQTTPNSESARSSVSRPAPAGAKHGHDSTVVSYHGLSIDVPGGFRITPTVNCYKPLTMIVVTTPANGTCLDRVTGVPLMPSVTKWKDVVILDKLDGPRPSSAGHRHLNGLDVYESPFKSGGGAIDGTEIDVPSLGVLIEAEGRRAVAVAKTAHAS